MRAEGRRHSSELATPQKSTPDFKNQQQSESVARDSRLTKQLRTSWRKEIEAEVAVELRNAYIGFEKQLSELSREEDLLAQEFASLTNSTHPAINNETLKLIIQKPSEAEALAASDPSIAQMKKTHAAIKRELSESEEDIKLRERMLAEQSSLESINRELKQLESLRKSTLQRIGSLERGIEACHDSEQLGRPSDEPPAESSAEQLMKRVVSQENSELIGDIKLHKEKLMRLEHLSQNLAESNRTLEAALSPKDASRNLVAYEQYLEYIVDQYEHFLKEVLADEAVHAESLHQRIRERSLAVATCREGYQAIKQKELEEFRRGDRSSFSPRRSFDPQPRGD